MQPFDWARTEVSTNLQTHNYDIEHPKHGEVVNTCFEGKDLHYSPYGRWDLCQDNNPTICLSLIHNDLWFKTSNVFFLCFSQITSIFRIDEEIAHHHEQHEVGIGTPVILRERSWKIRHEQEGLECSSSSNIGSHQGDDSTSAQNDCFTSVQVNQAIMATDDEVEGVYSNTNGQGLFFLSFSLFRRKCVSLPWAFLWFIRSGHHFPLQMARTRKPHLIAFDPEDLRYHKEDISRTIKRLNMYKSKHFKDSWSIEGSEEPYQLEFTHYGWNATSWVDKSTPLHFTLSINISNERIGAYGTLSTIWLVHRWL